FGKLHQGNNDDVETIRARVRLLDNMSDVYLRFGDLTSSLDAAQTSLAAAELLPEADGEREAHVAYAHTRVGDALAAQGKLDEAPAEYRLELKAMLPLIPQSPDANEYLSTLSISYDRLGDIDRDQGELDAALGEYQAGSDIRSKLLAK